MKRSTEVKLRKLVERIIKEESETESPFKTFKYYEELVDERTEQKLKSSTPDGTIKTKVGLIYYKQFGDGEVFAILNDTGIVVGAQDGEIYIEGIYPEDSTNEKILFSKIKALFRKWDSEW